MRAPSVLSGLFFLGISGIISPESLAGQRLDGTVFFEAAPRLENARTTFNKVQMRGATYYFTLTIPSEANEPLGQVIINQRNGIDGIPLLLDETIAFIGTSNNREKILSLANVSQSEDDQETIIQFDSSVAPGNTITIGLRPRKNPKFSGVYLFGITVFPAGKKSQELYLGVRRLQFYDRSNDNDFQDFP